MVTGNMQTIIRAAMLGVHLSFDATTEAVTVVEIKPKRRYFSIAFFHAVCRSAVNARPSIGSVHRP